MARFRKKPVVAAQSKTTALKEEAIVAVQWTGKNADEIGALVGTSLKPRGGKLTVETAFGPVKAAKNDWVVRDSTDMVFVWTPGAFHAAHEAVS